MQVNPLQELESKKILTDLNNEKSGDDVVNTILDVITVGDDNAVLQAANIVGDLIADITQGNIL